MSNLHFVPAASPVVTAPKTIDKLSAIKLVRAAFGYTLRQSKALVEAWQEFHRWEFMFYPMDGFIQMVAEHYNYRNN